MEVGTATDPGYVGRPNEDFVGVAPGVVVLLDGAGIPGTEEVCRHGVAWYSRTLGATLLAGAFRADGADLVGTLARSIEQVAARHRSTCDLADARSPQATVAVLRVEGDRAGYLVLADAFLALARADGAAGVVTDPRETAVRAECTTLLRGLTEGTPDHERAWRSAVDAFRARRNRPGGYWIAKDDPQAAAEAVTGSVALGDLTGAALLSNGASRIVDPYDLADWPTVLQHLRTAGPGALLRRIRRAESEASGRLAGFRSPDDATVAWCDLTR